MTISIRTAIELLSDVLAGVHPPAYFQQNHIASTALNIHPASLNRKLKEERFTLWDLRSLAEYFQLGEEGYRVFEAEDEHDFLARLQQMGIGKFQHDPAPLFLQGLFAGAQRSTSSLSFTRAGNRNPDRGLIGPENRTVPTGLVLCIGDSGFVEYRYEERANMSWFALIDAHLGSGAVRLLNPVFEESVIALGNQWLRYPPEDVLTVDGLDSLGPHRLFALSVTDSYLDEIRAQSARLLKIHNVRDSRDVPNHFAGILDAQAVEALQKFGVVGIGDVATLDYSVLARTTV